MKVTAIRSDKIYKKMGKTIFEATITSTDDILKEIEEFWK